MCNSSLTSFVTVWLPFVFPTQVRLPAPSFGLPDSRRSSRHPATRNAFAPPSRAAAQQSPLRSALLRVHNEPSFAKRMQPRRCLVDLTLRFVSAPPSNPHRSAALSSGGDLRDLRSRTRTYAMVQRVGRFRPPFALRVMVRSRFPRPRRRRTPRFTCVVRPSFRRARSSWLLSGAPRKHRGFSPRFRCPV